MPIPLTADYDAACLRAAVRASENVNPARRVLTLASIYDGATRSEAATIGSITVQIFRDWVVKLNTHGPEGLINRNHLTACSGASTPREVGRSDHYGRLA